MNYGTFDTQAALDISLDQVSSLFRDQNVERLYVKKLSPNDNSKNQPYFGADLPDVAFLPSGELHGSVSDSGKKKKRSIKYKASLALSWLSASGAVHPAPNSKLIYYPQYPEVRFSGFLQGSGVDVGEWMDPKKRGRAEGRWLLLGVAPDEHIYAYLAVPNSALASELYNVVRPGDGVFSSLQIGIETVAERRTSKQTLLDKLREIHLLDWVPSQKLGKDGIPTAYKAANGGGYTLESLLGIAPNGYAEPDFLGWEVKQFGVTRFPLTGARVTTLFTPEPDGGVYVERGFAEFMKGYGYGDRSGISDRINFGGTHYYGRRHNRTGLTLRVCGFDVVGSSLLDPNGGIALIDDREQIAAKWSFVKIIEHWKRKHALAVYVPCMKKRDSTGVYYRYGKNVELGEGSRFEMLLASVVRGSVYYDPGLKLENASIAPRQKKRNQFRVKHKHLTVLYNNFQFVDLVSTD